MLVPSEVFHRHSWVCIDPGLVTCGISVFDIQDKELNSIDAFTIKSNQNRFESDIPEEYHSDRIRRMHELCLAYEDVLIRKCPILVCCESPFYNPRMPSAYGSLMETVTALRTVTNNVNPNVPFVLFAPQVVKQSFKQSGQQGKLVMMEALKNNSFLMSKLLPSIETLDEHAIDAVAVGYTWWLSQNNN